MVYFIHQLCRGLLWSQATSKSLVKEYLDLLVNLTTYFTIYLQQVLGYSNIRGNGY